MLILTPPLLRGGRPLLLAILGGGPVEVMLRLEGGGGGPVPGAGTGPGTGPEGLQLAWLTPFQSGHM